MAPSSVEPVEVSTVSGKSNFPFCKGRHKVFNLKTQFVSKKRKVSKTGTWRRKYESWGNKKCSTALKSQHSVILVKEGGDKVK